MCITADHYEQKSVEDGVLRRIVNFLALEKLSAWDIKLMPKDIKKRSSVVRSGMGRRA